MLTNAYLLAKIGADTAENEQHVAEILPIGRRVADRALRCLRRRVWLRRGEVRRMARAGSFRLLRRFLFLGRGFLKLHTSIHIAGCTAGGGWTQNSEYQKTRRRSSDKKFFI